MLAIVGASRSAVHVKSSSAGSAAVQLADRSLDHVGGNRVCKSGHLPMNTHSSSTAGSLNWRLKCSVTHVFSSAALQITRPAASWIVNLATGFLVIKRTAQNMFAPSRRRSTYDASLSSPVEVLSRAFRRRARKVVLRWRFSSPRRMTSDVFCSHSFSFRCSGDIAAISAQCGPYDRESVNNLLYVCRQMTKSVTLYMGTI